MGFFSLILEQALLVRVQVAVAGLAAVLDKVKQRVQVVDLVDDLLGPCDPQLPQARALHRRGTLCLRLQGVVLRNVRRLHRRTLRVKGRACRVLRRLLERSRTVSGPGPLEAQEIDALLAIERLLHRILCFFL